MKIYNFHPFHVALNMQSLKFYEEHRFLYQKKLDFSSYVNKRQGMQNFFRLIQYLREKKTFFWYLDDLYLELLRFKKEE